MDASEQYIQTDLYGIVRGASRLIDGKKDPFFFKHSSTAETLKSEESYLKVLLGAKKRGLLSEKGLLAAAAKNKKWVTEDEEYIKGLKWEIESLTKVQKKTVDNTQKTLIQMKIDEKKGLIKDKIKTREKICELSAENFAERKRTDAFIDQNCFQDEALTIPCKELDAGAYEALGGCLKRLGVHHYLLQLAYAPAFFDLYMIYRKQPHMLFGPPISAFDLTLYQKNLVILAGILANRLEFGGEKLTDAIRQDPIKLYNFDPDGAKAGATEGIADLKEKQKMQGKLKPEDYLS